MKTANWMCVLGAMAVVASGAWGALSNNLFNGDFENTATLKSNYTYDNANNPVGAHRFNADGPDFGKWIGRWGLMDSCWNGYCGQGGFSTFDHPRQLGATMVGVSGDPIDDISNNNRSLDPYNPASGNHIMETVSFYPTMTTWVRAPQNQMPGAMQLSFDFFLNHWDAAQDPYIDRFDIRVYGSNFLPPHNVAMGTDIPGTGFDGYDPTNGATSVDTVIDGVHYRSQMLARFGWGGWWSNDLDYPETNGWKNRDSTNPSAWFEAVDPADAGSVIIPVNLTETFDYYSVTISTMIYTEGHEYFWLVEGYGVNGYNGETTPAIGFDNIDFRVSVVPEPATLGVLGLGAGLLVYRRRA